MTDARRRGELVDRILEASIVGSFGRTGYTVRRRLERWTEADGCGRRILVTGANSGIGLAVTERLLERGAEVVLTTRSPAKSAATLAHLHTRLGPDAASRARAIELDLSALTSVRQAAERLLAGPPIDVIVHNAGAMFPTRALTEDGLEQTYQVHVVGPFLLTALLLPMLQQRPDPRVVLVASGGMYTEALSAGRIDSPGRYRPAVAYARAKRGQVELSAEWHARLAVSTGIAFHAMHPGWVHTPGLTASLPAFSRALRPLLRTPEQGADTIVDLALAPRQAEADAGGRFWLDRRPRPEHRLRRTRTPASERALLWRRVAADASIDPSPA
jgi:dehydrogenase/reductase SDR family member 12